MVVIEQAWNQAIDLYGNVSISGDASPVSSLRTLIWTAAIILFAQAVLMLQ